MANPGPPENVPAFITVPPNYEFLGRIHASCSLVPIPGSDVADLDDPEVRKLFAQQYNATGRGYLTERIALMNEQGSVRPGDLWLMPDDPFWWTDPTDQTRYAIWEAVAVRPVVAERLSSQSPQIAQSVRPLKPGDRLN